MDAHVFLVGLLGLLASRFARSLAHHHQRYCTPVYLSHKRSEGGVVLQNVTLYDDYDRAWLWANPYEPHERVFNVTGSVTVYNPFGCTENVSSVTTNVSMAVDCRA